MKRCILVTGFVALAATGCRDRTDQSERYFGQVPPGDTPVVFAPGVISQEDRFEQFLLFAPDGQELTFGVTNADWSAFTLYSMRMEEGRWTEPRVPPFLGSDSTALTWCLSFELDKAFFTSPRPSYPPSDIWMSTRGDRGWSDPAKLGAPISSDADEFEVSISRNGTLYFSSNRDGGQGDFDIYRAPLVDGH